MTNPEVTCNQAPWRYGAGRKYTKEPKTSVAPETRKPQSLLGKHGQRTRRKLRWTEAKRTKRVKAVTSERRQNHHHHHQHRPQQSALKVPGDKCPVRKTHQ